MLFRTRDGTLIEINKSYYNNDKIYFKKIKEIKNSLYNISSKEEKQEKEQLSNSYSAQAIKRLLCE